MLLIYPPASKARQASVRDSCFVCMLQRLLRSRWDDRASKRIAWSIQAFTCRTTKSPCDRFFLFFFAEATAGCGGPQCGGASAAAEAEARRWRAGLESDKLAHQIRALWWSVNAEDTKSARWAGLSTTIQRFSMILQLTKEKEHSSPQESFFIVNARKKLHEKVRAIVITKWKMPHLSGRQQSKRSSAPCSSASASATKTSFCRLSRQRSPRPCCWSIESWWNLGSRDREPIWSLDRLVAVQAKVRSNQIFRIWRTPNFPPRCEDSADERQFFHTRLSLHPTCIHLYVLEKTRFWSNLPFLAQTSSLMGMLHDVQIGYRLRPAPSPSLFAGEPTPTALGATRVEEFYCSFR